MAFIHPMSCECLKSELDLFSLPPTQTSIESSHYAEYPPVSSLADAVPIEFVISGSGQDYLDLSNLQLYVRAQITTAAGVAVDNAAHVFPVNMLLHSMFSEIEIRCNDTLVSSSNGTYGYRAMLETLLSYSPETIQSQLKSALFYKDIADSMEEADPHLATAVNTGMTSRYAHVTAGRIVDLVGNLFLDLCHQDRLMLNDVNIKLVRAKDSFVLMSDTQNAAFKLKVVDCRLFARKVKISPSVFLAHSKALEISNAKYPVRRVVCKTFTIPAGSLDVVKEHLYTGVVPSRLVICFVDNDAYNESYTKKSI
jgi:hypothetical protein